MLQCFVREMKLTCICLSGEQDCMIIEVESPMRRDRAKDVGEKDTPQYMPHNATSNFCVKLSLLWACRLHLAGPYVLHISIPCVE